MKQTLPVYASVLLFLSIACNKTAFDGSDKTKKVPIKQEERTVTAPNNVATSDITADTGSAPMKVVELLVSTPSNMLKAGGEKLQATAKIKDSDEAPSVLWTIQGFSGKKDIGSIDANGVYTSPATNDKEFPVTITATLRTDPKVTASTSIQILPKDQIFATCTQGSVTFPIIAQVYSVPNTTTHVPNYDNPAEATKVSTVCMDKYAVEPRDFSEGFPNLKNFIEFFSLQTSTTLIIPADGSYVFQLNSDDGSRLSIDGKEVIDNDGQHQAYGPGPDESLTVGRKEVTLTLKKGDHPLVLNYFQGPKYRIALVLKWKTPGATDFVYVPRESFK